MTNEPKALDVDSDTDAADHRQYAEKALKDLAFYREKTSDGGSLSSVDIANVLDHAKELATRLMGRDAECTARGKMLCRLRDDLVNMRDELADEQDRVYFGSTNDADDFRRHVQELEEFKWDIILSEAGEPDVYQMLRVANEKMERISNILDE